MLKFQLFILIFVILTTILLTGNQTESARAPQRRFNGIRNLRRSNRSKIPLRTDRSRRRPKRAGECRLGRSIHEIGDNWNPDLGEPFGIMYCIKCSCEPVQKKRRIVGRVRCRNIKNECPKVECADAISLPGQCCKVCPAFLPSSDNQTYDFGEEQDVIGNNKEYAALLTPRTSTLIKSSTGLGEGMSVGLGAGRFLFLRRNLYFSFIHNEGIPRAKFVQFIDSEGNILEEQEVSLNTYQNETKKICGVWKKIPRIYRKLLKEEKLFAALVTEKIGSDNDRYLAGRIAKQRYVANELYSSLLEPSNQSGTGGMAVLTVSASTGSIYVSVIFNGNFGEEHEIGITVRLADVTGIGRAIEETKVLQKINYESNTVEIRTILEVEQLQALSRGTLFLLVYSKRNPSFKIVGAVQARTTCDVFDAVLSSEDGSNSGVNGGVGWIYPLPGNGWSFHISLPPEHDPVTSKLETGRRVLEELPFKLLQNTTNQVMTGVSSRYYQLLYEESLYLAVVTTRGTLRGKLHYRGFGDAQLADAPLILSPPSGVLPPKPRAEGLLWIGVDTSCTINYQVSLSERPQTGLMRLEVMEMPSLHLLGIPVQSYTLNDFEASEFEGEFNDIEKKSTFANMNAGDASFRVLRVNDSSLLASVSLRQVRVPQNCLPEVPKRETFDPYVIEPEDESSYSMPQPSRCFYDGKLRDEFSQWSPPNDTCQICSCYKGKVTCDTVICPHTNCSNPVLLTGECCRTCLHSDKMQKAFGGRSCEVSGERTHPAGTSWHPYIPPDGFMACTTCTCNVDTLTVECVKETCAPLSCSASSAYYPHPLACCRVCPVITKQDAFQDDAFLISRQPTEADILREGGCKFRGTLHKNGEEWNHRIEPFGFTPCIICSCKNGTSKCGRIKCPSLNCEAKVKADGECCPKCIESGKRVSPSKKESSSTSALMRLSSRRQKKKGHRSFSTGYGRKRSHGGQSHLKTSPASHYYFTPSKLRSSFS